MKVILYLKIFVLECEYQSKSLNTSECSYYNFFSVKKLTQGITFNCFILFNFGMKVSILYVICKS